MKISQEILESYKGSIWNNLLFDSSDSYLTLFPSHSFWLFYSKYWSLRVTSFLFLFVLNACILPSSSFFPIGHKCLPLPQLLRIGQSLVKDALLVSEPLDLQLEQADVFDPLLVVKVPLAQDWLLDSDLLIQQCTLVIAMQQLLAQAVPLSDHLERTHNQNLFLCLSLPVYVSPSLPVPVVSSVGSAQHRRPILSSAVFAALFSGCLHTALFLPAGAWSAAVLPVGNTGNVDRSKHGFSSVQDNFIYIAPIYMYILKSVS